MLFRTSPPSLWPRRCHFPWRWEVTGSSAPGQSTAWPSRLLSDSRTASTKCPSGAKWWSSAQEVRRDYFQIVTCLNKRKCKRSTKNCCEQIWQEHCFRMKSLAFQRIFLFMGWVWFLFFFFRLCHGTLRAASPQGHRLCREAAEILCVLSQPASGILWLCQVSLQIPDSRNAST